MLLFVRRPWFQYHLSTAFILMLVAGTLLGANVVLVVKRVDVDGVIYPQREQRGFPFAWQSNLCYHRVEYSGWVLFFDIVVSLSVLAGTGWCCEWLIRQRNQKSQIENRIPLILAALLLLSLCSAHAADWPQWRGPERNGTSPEKDWFAPWPAEGPKRLWKAAVGTGISSVAVAQGRAYTLGNTANQDTVFCLNAVTGEIIWKHSYACPLNPNSHPGGPVSTATVDGSRVYTFSKAGHLHCFNAVDGKVLWSLEVTKEFGAKAPMWGFASSPLIVGELLVLNAGVSGIALDKTTGKAVWQSPNEPSGYQGSGPAGYASPVLLGKERLAIFGHDALRGVNLADGKMLWQFPWKTSYGENSTDPVVIEDRVFISSGHGLGSALLKIGDGNPEVVWENKAFGNHVASAVLYEGHLYGFNGRIHRDPGELLCVDVQSGETKWTKAPLRGSLILAGGRLIILTLEGLLIVAEANASEYREHARAQVLGGKCWTSPTLAGGRLFVRNAGGEVACLELK